ncbi:MULTISPECIES: hypothetical protein [Kamptonema]|nr:MULTISPECIES: hypothetical protein [Kamptonema]
MTPVMAGGALQVIVLTHGVSCYLLTTDGWVWLSCDRPSGRSRSANSL